MQKLPDYSKVTEPVPAGLGFQPRQPDPEFMLLPTAPCYSPIHSFLCSRTSNAFSPKSKNQNPHHSQQGPSTGVPTTSFPSSPTTGLATLMGTLTGARSRVSALTVPATRRASSSRQLQGWHLHFITVSTQICSPQ